jgi:biopolymer transport protein ExbD
VFDLAHRRRQRAAKEPISLNLNSMMDMLSIILVFLLANISAEEQDFVLASNLVLPDSSSELGFTQAVQLKLTRKELLIEDTFVARIRGKRVVGVQIEGGKIVPLYNMLQRYRSLSKDADKTTVVLQADKDFPFEVLNQVMRTSAMAGYPNFRFAIQKK